MQALVGEKRTMIAELTQVAKVNSRQTMKLLKSSMSIRDKTIERARQRDEKSKMVEAGVQGLSQTVACGN